MAGLAFGRRSIDPIVMTSGSTAQRRFRPAVCLFGALALWSAAGGCGGPASYDDFRDQVASRWCDRLVRCGQLGASEVSQCPAAPPLGLVTGGADLDIDAALDAGALQFHGGRAQRCLEAIKSAPCSVAQSALDFTRYCNAIVEPRLVPGKACRASQECLGGGCVETTVGCGGSCVAFAATGAACMPGATDPSLLCDPTVHFCGSDGTCQLQKSAGGACAGDTECTFDLACVAGKCADPPRGRAGQVCGGSAPPCLDGLGCNENGRCVSRVGSGSACSADGDDCQAGLVCVGGKCSAWSDAGGACLVAASGASGCPATQTCVNSVCQPATTAVSGPGSHCTGDDGCGDSLWCDGSLCSYRNGLGGSCRADDNCRGGLTCDTTSQTCVDPSCSSAS